MQRSFTLHIAFNFGLRWLLKLFFFVSSWGIKIDWLIFVYRCFLSLCAISDLFIDNQHIDWTMHMPTLLHVAILGKWCASFPWYWSKNDEILIPQNTLYFESENSLFSNRSCLHSNRYKTIPQQNTIYMRSKVNTMWHDFDLNKSFICLPIPFAGFSEWMCIVVYETMTESDTAA